jgi:hypothetical protein
MKRKKKPIVLSWVTPEFTGYLRPWPDLVYEDGRVAARIVTDEVYVWWKSMCSEHKPLRVSVVNYSRDPPTERIMRPEFENMVGLKIWMYDFLKHYEQYAPKKKYRKRSNDKSLPQPV